MNTPMFLTSAPLSSRPHSHNRHRAKRPVVGVLSGLTCAALLGMALLSGVAVGGMGGVLTREYLHPVSGAAAVAAQAAPAPAPAPVRPVLSLVRPQPPNMSATALRASARTEAAALTRAFRMLYNPVATHAAAGADFMGPPAPSA